MTSIKIPAGNELAALLRLRSFPSSDLFSQSVDQNVTAPLKLFLSHEGKGLRAKVVEAGFQLGAGKSMGEKEKSYCEAIAESMEAIHAGSLIVDDVQDNAQVRRGAPALHLTYGIPTAINLGNLLYFWGLRRMSSAGLPVQVELACSTCLNEELLRAHYGQAVDVGVLADEIPQNALFDLYLASARLKSGVLMALALRLGAISAGATDARLRKLDELGHLLGMGLQMFDDINNLTALSATDPNLAKRFEDFYQRRQTWVWAFAAKTSNASDYSEFKQSVILLPDESRLRNWLKANDFINRARAAAKEFIQSAFEGFEAGESFTESESEALSVLHKVAKTFTLGVTSEADN